MHCSQERSIGDAARCLVLVFSLSLILPSGCSDGSRAQRTGSATAEGSLLLVVVDTLRADHLGLYGYPRETSPFLDELSETSIVFDNAFSHYSYTWPTIANLFTGRSFSHLVSSRDFVEPEESDGEALRGRVVTLAEKLREEGIRTFGVSANPYISNMTGFGQGFGTFHDVYSWDPDFWEGTLRKYRVQDVNAVLLPLVLRATMERDTPFFAYVHYFDPHMPYTAPGSDRRLFEDPGYRREGRVVDGFLRQEDGDYLVCRNSRNREWLSEADVQHLTDQYDAEIHHLDRGLRGLFAEMQDAGVLQNTTVVITADHGEAFFEHDCWGHGRLSLGEEEWVPLIVVPSGARRREARRVSAAVTTSDLYYSVCRYFGLEPPEDGHEGRMPWQVDVLGPTSFDPVVFSSGPGLGMILRDERYSYYRYTEIEQRLARHFPDGAPPVTDGEYLFDRVADPGEVRNLFTIDAQEAVAVRDRMLESCDGCPVDTVRGGKGPVSGVEGEHRERLRALGYVE